MSEKISRRRYLKYAVGGVAAIAAAAGGYYFTQPSPSTTTSATTVPATTVPALQYSGISTTFYCMASPTTDAAKKLSKDFDAMTGLDTHVLELDWSELVAKAMMELTGRTGAIDVCVFDEVQTDMYGPYAHELRDFSDIADPKLLAMDDFSPPIVKLLTTTGGRLVGIPSMCDSTMLVYRKDLFEDEKNKRDFVKQFGYELHPPQNGDEFKDIAKFFQRPKENMYGMSDNWSTPYMVRSTGGWLRAHGGNWFEDWQKGDLTPTIDTDPMRMAMKDCIWFLENATPPDILSFDNALVTQQLATGRSPMGITWFSSMPDLHKPEFSKYYEQFRYGVHPLSGNTGHMGWFIPKDSKHAEAAYKLVEWICSPQNQLTFVQFGGTPFRTSSISDPNILKVLAGGGPWAPNLAEMGLKNLDTAWSCPHFTEYFGWEDFACKWIARILGKSVSIDEGIKGLQKETEDFMKKLGYI